MRNNIKFWVVKMKMLKKVILFLIFFSISIGFVAVGNGYNMYKKALEEMPLEEKVSSIREKANYARIQEMPQNINAIISAIIIGIFSLIFSISTLLTFYLIIL